MPFLTYFVDVFTRKRIEFKSKNDEISKMLKRRVFKEVFEEMLFKRMEMEWALRNEYVFELELMDVLKCTRNEPFKRCGGVRIKMNSKENNNLPMIKEETYASCLKK